MRSRSRCERVELVVMQRGLKREAMSPETRRRIAEGLPEFLQRQRWFGGKARGLRSVEVEDVIGVGGVTVLVAGVKYADGAEERYALPVIGAGEAFRDAMGEREFLSALLDSVKNEDVFRGERGSLRGCRTKNFGELWDANGEGAEPRVISGEQSNSSVVYGEKLILKFIRRMEEGENPDLEIGRFLSEQTSYQRIAKVAGYLEYDSGEGGCVTQGIVQEFVANEGDAWRHVQKILAECYARERRVNDSQLLEQIALLGKRTAELHLALGSEREDAAFAPEKFTREFQAELRRSFEELTRRTMETLRGRAREMDSPWKEKADELQAREQKILRQFRVLSDELIDAERIRIHGDYHLGQVLWTGTNFVIIDFEGEPARPLAERRKKQSPLQDVAGMLRSFEYAAFAPLLMPSDAGGFELRNRADLGRAAEEWSVAAGERFLAEYIATCGGAAFLPAREEQRSALLKVYLLAKAVYELGYELNNRPGWVGLPMEGILRLLAA